MAHDQATQRQIAAARPDQSTWLSANAGSGKTKVLTDRVARLLLEGVDPQHILCLTYTKAAASEMQNRLFRRLGEWSMLPDHALSEQLVGLGYGSHVSEQVLRDARRLFASAIETPGGLKIQTIHSFCSAVLRRFPFEAGVTPQFSEIEERSAALLRAEIVEGIGAGPHADVLYNLARHFTGDSLDSLTAEIVRFRARFSPTCTEEELDGAFGLPQGFAEQDLRARVFLGGERALLSDMSAAMAHGTSTDQKNATKLQAALLADPIDLIALEDVFLVKTGAKKDTAKLGSFPTKACREANLHLMDELEALMSRVEEGRKLRVALAARQRTRALYDFASIFLPKYEQAKQARGWLDFDDLILRTRDLLTQRKVADWVLFKLDGEIDHILVDEAQDTSPVQWQVIEALAQEFTSGQGSRSDRARTIFVVGDKKQSIYSFQGADPREFDRMKSEFAARLQNTATPLQDLEMAFSFRSAACILSVVDETFENHEGSGFVPGQRHQAFKTQLPGRVDLWPPVAKSDAPEQPAWYQPVDIKTPDDPASILAQHIANKISDLVGRPLPGEPGKPARAITPGDILILVRRRSALFHDIIRACKARGLPVAGADRLRVGAELAVRDIAALLSYLATPEDDLSLAITLRSPLFGWSEAELFDLCHARSQKYLSAELRDRADAFPETMAVLDDLRSQVDFLRPYELIERILTRHHGRRNLLARLGPEAEDGLDALLSQAMAYERNAVDSLTGFLVWMETDELEIKRQPDSASDRIRVMTVHGAKGLEAPVVILPETGQWQNRVAGDLAENREVVVWRANQSDASELQSSMDDAMRLSQQAERDRLLYVAMTRAEQWLIVAAAGELGKDGQSWHDKVHSGLKKTDAQPFEFPSGSGLRLETGDWSDPDMAASTEEIKIPQKLPEFFDQAAPMPEATEDVLSPSDLGGAKALPDERGLDQDAAMRRGRQVHKLIEILPDVPPEDQAAVAARLLSFGEDKAEGEELALLLAEAQAVFSKPGLKALFDQNTLAEVSISAELGELGNRRIHGVIDRLVVMPDRVLAVDFKTNAMVPDHVSECPEGLLRQMGAYRAALLQIYPDRKVETALLWTRNASFMRLPHDLVIDALANTHIP